MAEKEEVAIVWKRKKYGAPPPSSTCRACWNELRANWAGAAHQLQYAACRRNLGLSMAQFQAQEAKRRRVEQQG